jgi:hypothetical protein
MALFIIKSPRSFLAFIIAGSYVIFNNRWRELVFAPQPPVDSAARRKTDHSTAFSFIIPQCDEIGNKKRREQAPALRSCSSF